MTLPIAIHFITVLAFTLAFALLGLGCVLWDKHKKPKTNIENNIKAGPTLSEATVILALDQGQIYPIFIISGKNQKESANSMVNLLSEKSQWKDIEFAIYDRMPHQEND